MPLRLAEILFSAALLLSGICQASPAAAQAANLDFFRQHLDKLRQNYQACTLEPVPTEHEFIAATIHDGETLANVLISPSAVSTIARVNVAPGVKPITA